MVIMGWDFHPRFQQIAYVDQESGDYGERRLSHPEQAAQFYRSRSAWRTLTRREVIRAPDLIE